MRRPWPTGGGGTIAAWSKAIEAEGDLIVVRTRGSITYTGSVV